MTCTIIGGFDAAGRPWLASNSDNPYSTRTRISVGIVDGVRFVGTRITSLEGSVEWDDMISRAVNEHGMGFTWSSIPNNLPSEGYEGFDLKTTGLRLVAAKDISDAISVLRRGGRNVSGCFLLADTVNSEIAIVEAAGGKTSISRISGREVVVKANHFEAEEMRQFEADVGYNPYRYSAAKRIDRAKELSDGEVSVQQLATILTDHDGREHGGEYGCSICNHGTAYGSVSSEILAPESGTIFYAFGWPCGEETPGDVLSVPWSSYLKFTLGLPDGEYNGSNGALSAQGVKSFLKGEISRLFRG